jgi:co-chaperonin GroES (HSP10)
MMMRVLGDRVLVALPPAESERESTTGFDYRTVDTTASGIILAHRADSYDEEASTRGIVMQVGEKTDSVSLEAVKEAILSAADDVFVDPATAKRAGWDVGPNGDICAVMSHDRALKAVKALKPAPFDVQVGDCVVFPPSAGSPFTHDGINYVILREDELLAVLEPQKADAA